MNTLGNLTLKKKSKISTLKSLKFEFFLIEIK